MPTERTRPPHDIGGIVCGLLFIGLGVWVITETAGMSRLGAVFPRSIAGALIVFSTIMVVVRLIRPRGHETPDPGSTPRRLGFIGVMTAWVLLLNVVGFFTTSLLCFLGLMLVAHHGRWTPGLAAALVLAGVVIVTAFQVLFTEALNVPLPTGLVF
ncbi:hypothetical protein C882_0347 [Caenispirillum salinarum AK4]|uniref:DUF1468 domain-containing protein n=1 Tax=Caenispirillum salinarum AK4 TaxID=1238182 RepID=K9GU77_9PROT|nr:tripartite tricarboxylate transporter TctB family protein [Caenispirillum salinarum]EKV29525.1 hypothetical protein C882_0347 [Caenispirillum salinarum AK4]